jgi:hypothetical protein
MKKNVATQAVENVSVEEPKTHFMKKSYTLISSKHVDYDNLTAIEAGAMTLALVLSVSVGVIHGLIS